MPAFADGECHVVSVTDPYGPILGCLYRSHYYFLRTVPQLYSLGCEDPVTEALLLGKVVAPAIEPGPLDV
jgi:hypothetical protein